MSIFNVAPITWTNDTPGNATTFNNEIKNKMTDIDYYVVDRNTAQTLTNKTLTSPVINTPTINTPTLVTPKVDAIHENTVGNGVNIDGVDLIDSSVRAAVVGADALNALTVNHVTITPGANKLVKTAVLRQNITTNVYINNTVILTGWTFLTTPGGGAAALQKIITFGITFSEIPIVIITPVSKKTGADPADLGQLGSTLHNTLEAGKATSISTTGFIGYVYTSVPYDAGDRVGFTWIAIGQLN